MTFARVNPPGWATGAKLTSAQQNQLDIDHANAIDKTGDSVGSSATITFPIGSTLHIATGATVTVDDATITIGAAGGIILDAASGITVESGAGITVLAGGVIESFGVGGIVPAVAGGITDGSITGGIATTTPGGLSLGGGSSDYPTFSATRTRTIVSPFDTTVATSNGTELAGIMPPGWGILASGSGGPSFGNAGGNLMLTTQVNASSNAAYSYLMPLRQLHNGATLTVAQMFSGGSAGHAGLPGAMPAFGIYRMDITGSIGTVAPLFTSLGTDLSGSTGAYQTNHSTAIALNQNNVIDTSRYAYYAVLWDEAGTNAQTQGRYYGISLSYSAIADMRFQ